jgi:putative tryptophan/tyrosine transport system substrate-binding protein
MIRRELITLLGSTPAAWLLGGTAVSWPLGARAQPTGPVRRIGVLIGYSENDPATQSLVATFRSALSKLGWTEGSNLRIELRWGNSDADRMRTFAKELFDLRLDAVLGQTTFATGALARETQTIPIVFVVVSDPIGSGFATNISHPDRNITGFTDNDTAMGGKWVQLLKEIAPRTDRVVLLVDPTLGPSLQFHMPSIQAAASSFAVQLRPIQIHAKDELEGVIAAQAHNPGGGLILMPNGFNAANHEFIFALAARYGVPSIYFNRLAAGSGGLISYGSDFAQLFRQAAGYIDRILKGAKPAELPIQLSTKFELVINLKTAKALGLIVPNTLLVAADEVIE